MTADRLPPHSIEAEQSVLGAILLDNETLDRINGSLAPDDFYAESHGVIFQHEAALRANGVPIDVTTLSNSLAAADKLDYVGGLAYLGSLVQNVPTAANALHYAGIVRERAELRRIAEHARRVYETARAAVAPDPATLAASARDTFDAVLGDTGRAPRPELIAGPAKALCGDLRGAEIPAPPFAVRRILPIEVGRVVGSGGSGKTTVLLDLGIHIVIGRAWYGHAVERPGAVLIVTAEDSRDVLRYRLQRLARAGDYTDAEIAAIERGIYIEDWSGEQTGRIAEPDRDGRLIESPAVNRLIRAYAGAGIALVVLDPLSLLGPGERFVNDGEIEVARIGRKLCKAFDAAVLVVHHVSQAVARQGITDQHAGRGGTAGADNARAVWQITAPPAENAPPEIARALANGSKVLAVHFHKVSHQPPIREPLIIERSGWMFRQIVTSAPATGAGPGGIDLAARAAADADKVLAYFKAGTDYKREEVVGACGVPRDRARTALATLERTGHIIRHVARATGGRHRPPEFLRLAPAQGRL